MTFLANPSPSEEIASCSGSRKLPVPPKQTLQLASHLKAVADPNRLTLLALLPSAPETICVCDLTAALDLSQPTVSHHLKILTEAGLVTREKRGTWVHYSRIPGRLEDLSHQLFAVVQVQKTGSGSSTANIGG